MRNYLLSLLPLLLMNVNESYSIPKPWEPAAMARYVIHKSDWVSIATVSTQDAIKGYPFVNLKSMSDGPVENGTGVPYFYMSDLDFTGQDIKANNNCTIMASMAETDYCNKTLKVDQQSPLCPRIFLAGKLVKVLNTTSEYVFAHNALFSRHPDMQTWPIDHAFYIAKLNLEHIGVLDFFGGAKTVSVEDYFNAVHLASRTYTRFNNIFIIDVQN